MKRKTYHLYGALVALFIAFLLLFIACVSVPFAQSVRLFTLNDHRTGGSIRFGLWGYCLTYINRLFSDWSSLVTR